MTNLVIELLGQCDHFKEGCELILIDDDSDECYKKEHRKIKKNILVTYIELEENIGRSAIRNKFLEYAKYENLLFLDCDSIVLNSSFLQNYISVLKNTSSKLICGGRVYEKRKPKKNKLLRWKYGVKRESKTFEERNINPNKSFMTNNFVVNKSILSSVKFDERLTKYGHEDTLFGFELEKIGISIVHINNTILNGYLEENEVFLKNTEYAIQNLIKILEIKKYDSEFIKHVTLLDYYYKNRIFLKKINFLLKPIKIMILKGFVNVELFGLYKLLVLSEGVYKKENNNN